MSSLAGESSDPSTISLLEDICASLFSILVHSAPSPICPILPFKHFLWDSCCVRKASLPLTHTHTHAHTHTHTRAHTVLTAEGSELSAEGWILGAGPKMCHSGHAWPAGGRNSVANGPRSRRHHLGIWETGWMEGWREGGREGVQHNAFLINRRMGCVCV